MFPYFITALIVLALAVFLRLFWKSIQMPARIPPPRAPEDDEGTYIEPRMPRIEFSPSNHRLRGKVALITGAGTGIGRAIALAFAREGAKVALMARRREKLEAVAKEIGANALICAGDVCNPQDIERTLRETVETFGGLHILVNNAAYLAGGTAESHTEEEWNTTLNTNITAVWRLCCAAIPYMRKAGGGSIINLSSVLGLVGAKNRVAYAASKGAVTLMTKSMALDHAAEKIRVNCICPGIVETDLVAGFINNAPDPELARRQRTALHPLGRFGRPEDVAHLAVFLASDESSWMTGAAIPIDGGYTAV